MKLCYIDFEFNNTSEYNLNLVSCSYEVDGRRATYWLHNNELAKGQLKRDLISLHKEGYTFASWAVTAEARSFLSLGLNPIRFRWLDLYLEYRCLTNHNHSMQYGKQLIKGVRRTTIPPVFKRHRTEEEKRKKDFSKPEHNLLAAKYKLLGEFTPPEFKDTMRELIISSPQEFTDEERKAILLYNESDIHQLKAIHEAIQLEYERLLNGETEGLYREMLLRGEYATRTAVMEREGYPINHEATQAFSDSVADILWEIQHEINELFPDIQPFEKDGKRRMVWKQQKTRDWVEKQKHSKWMLTDKGKLSLSLDAFKDHYDFRHSFPKDNFGAQMVRYLSLKQQLNGFSPNSKNSFWDYVGSDNRARAYFGIYGAQSARSQPKATGFLFLKSAWMRGLVQPAKGRAIWGIDYKSQEFLLGALLSGDENMLQAYESGDVYLHFAKLAGAVPMEGTRKEYPDERDLFKSTTLGISYGMGKDKLAVKLSNDTGKKIYAHQAQSLINKFKRAFKTYSRYRDNIIVKYKEDGHLKLPCGWYCWGDNPNVLSVQNCPVQGFGSSIMRKAVALAQDNGLKVIMTLHDAIYIEADVKHYTAGDVLAKCMDEAFRFYFKEELKSKATVGLEGNVWGPDLKEEYRDYFFLKGVKHQPLYIDSRSKVEYEKFKKYFTPETEYEI